MANFSSDKDLGDYELYDFLEKRVDYSKRYYHDKKTYLVTGYTPAIYIKGWEKRKSIRRIDILQWTAVV